MLHEKLRSSKLLLLIAFLAHIPIALEYTVRMWQTGHYQYFPLIVMVVGWLWYQMSDELLGVAEKPVSNIIAISILGVLALVTVATVFNSSFIGAISMVALFSLTLYTYYGLPGLIKALPLVFVSLFALPLPAKLDSRLIFELQFIASKLASWILDALQQIHFREGVVLKTETHGFLTEEACSGIRSLFSSLAGIAIYGVTMNYPWWRHTFNLVQCLFWVVVGNAFRVAIVVYVSENYSDRIASGRPHDILGLVVFLFIFLLSVSTDRLFGAFVREASEEVELDETKYVESGIEPVGQVEYASDVRSTSMRTLCPAWVSWVVLPICLSVFVFGARLTYSKTYLNQGLGAYVYDRLSFPSETDLPKKIGNWIQVSFEHTNRGKEKLQAEDSFIWTYEYQGLIAVVSMDCPWDEWHDLSYCYSGLGWNTQSSHFFEDGDRFEVGASEFENEQFSQLGMNKNGGESGVVLFSAVDATGKLVTPQFSSGLFSVKSVWQQFLSNLSSGLGLPGDQEAGLKGYKFPLSTIQVFCTPETEITTEQLSELRRLFVDSRKLLIETERFQQK